MFFGSFVSFFGSLVNNSPMQHRWQAITHYEPVYITLYNFGRCLSYCLFTVYYSYIAEKRNQKSYMALKACLEEISSSTDFDCMYIHWVTKIWMICSHMLMLQQVTRYKLCECYRFSGENFGNFNYLKCKKLFCRIKFQWFGGPRNKFDCPHWF